MAASQPNRAPLLPQLTPKAINRFWSKVNKTDGCWLWMAGTSRRGYGSFKIGDRTIASHRLSLAMALCQEIPDDKVVCHHCDTAGCVNPSHLFVGTQSENVRDCIAKGRGKRAYGERTGGVKLTEAAVIQIRERRANGESICQLANEFGVVHGTIEAVCDGRTWKHLL